MQKGHISYLLFGKARSDMLPEHVSNDCPPGSDCAKAAVERVRRVMNEPRRIGINLHRDRFVEKTGRDE